MTRKRGRTFLEWCLSNSGRGDSVGDFCRDWVADKERPRATELRDWFDVRDYIEGQGAIRAAVYASAKAWREWVQEQMWHPGETA